MAKAGWHPIDIKAAVHKKRGTLTQIALDAPESDDDGSVSTLRILQLLAGAAFLASGFYVFVWPRLSRGGS